MKKGQSMRARKSDRLDSERVSSSKLPAQEAISGKDIFYRWAQLEQRRKEVFFYYELVLISCLCILFGIVVCGNFPVEVKQPAGTALAIILAVIVRHMIAHN